MMATLTATSIPTRKLIALINEADPKGELHLRIANQDRLEIGSGLFSASFSIDLSTETLHTLAKPTTPVTTLVSPGRTTGSYWYQINGRQFRCSSAKALLLESLVALASADPQLLDKLSAVKKRTKRIVARNRYDLFDKRHLADECAVQMPNGWWVGTNNNTGEVRSWLKIAAQLSPNVKFSTSI